MENDETLPEIANDTPISNVLFKFTLGYRDTHWTTADVIFEVS